MPLEVMSTADLQRLLKEDASRDLYKPKGRLVIIDLVKIGESHSALVRYLVDNRMRRPQDQNLNVLFLQPKVTLDEQLKTHFRTKVTFNSLTENEAIAFLQQKVAERSNGNLSLSEDEALRGYEVIVRKIKDGHTTMGFLKTGSADQLSIGPLLLENAVNDASVHVPQERAVVLGSDFEHYRPWLDRT
jgi:hypothetical protein